ncbi:MAG TPA: LysM peptidoglycan-binding domain-containing protein [Candidatus Acidoferrales bacterium]|nr:LysM peptidoglycan-binding domain-containing protein [Candidatus Acidoferrales bacterium]
MLRTGFDTPLVTGPSTAARLSRRCLSFCFPGIVLVSCAVFGATQCSAQDVAEAARQERAQKESKQKKSKHVYTEQDLKRERILTPEDRAQVEAKKNQLAAPAAEKAPEAVDAQSLSPDAPLGDVARHFRKQKQSQKLQQSAEFHLPFANAPALASPKPPVLASPKPPVMPLRPRVSKPAAPRFAPYQPPVKRSPFERPKVFFAAPALVMPSRPPALRVMPSQPAAPASVAPVAPVVPVAPRAAKLKAVIVRPGDSLWKIAQQNLGRGPRWHDLLAVNPGIVDANHIVAGSQIYLPAPGASLRTAAKITVRRGDTLSKIAQTQLGHASYWSCIAMANPAIRDANVIFEGQVLLLPGSCRP